MKPPALPPTVGSRLARIGLWLQLAPLIGIGDTLRQVWQAVQPVFEKIKHTGHADPLALARVMNDIIKASLTSSMIGTVISTTGAALIVLAYYRYHHRPRWASVFILAFIALGILSLGLAYFPL